MADVHASRGLSGIDGQISTAVGLALDGRPVVALLGDQTIRHDLSGLAQLAETNLPVVVVGVDNGGGQIFRDLPFAADVSLDDFVSPRSTDLGAVANALGLRTVVAEDRESFAQGFAALSATQHRAFARQARPGSGTASAGSQSNGQFGMPSVVAVAGFLGDPSDFDGVIAACSEDWSWQVLTPLDLGGGSIVEMATQLQSISADVRIGYSMGEG